MNNVLVEMGGLILNRWKHKRERRKLVGGSLGAVYTWTTCAQWLESGSSSGTFLIESVVEYILNIVVPHKDPKHPPDLS